MKQNCHILSKNTYQRNDDGPLERIKHKCLCNTDVYDFEVILFKVYNLYSSSKPNKFITLSKMNWLISFFLFVF